jgi:hypothetical protein
MTTLSSRADRLSSRPRRQRQWAGIQFAFLALALAACAGTPSHSPYSGQEQREIKALSSAEVHGLLEGWGLGYAKAAELNRYPGPMHVLEIGDKLVLTPRQREAIENILKAHKAEARELGAKLVQAERELDAQFARRTATPDSVEAHSRKVGELSASLRASHLKAHLATTALLTGAQVDRYEQLRGYSSHH